VVTIALPETLEPLQVLGTLLAIEQKLGRNRDSNTDGYQSRSIDLDLLVVEGAHMETKALTLPHPRMHLRRFVLEPLAELAPQLELTKGGPTVAELLRSCADRSAVQRLESAL
jgi:2-amino-4-hydroxy-6-hydroxymethyldihydropteridine diphosphokinase